MKTDSLKKAFGLLALFTSVPLCLIADRNDVGEPRVLQGPMVGAVEPETIRIWARVTGEHEVAVEYGTDPFLINSRQSRSMVAKVEDDFTVVIELKDLAPGTDYYYRVLVEGEGPKYLKNKRPFRVRTAPVEATRFTVGFGSCVRYGEDRVQPIWKEVQVANPDLFFWLGDNIYGDTLRAEVLAEEYRRQRDVALLQPVIRSIPQLATWDDHDFALNDHDRENPLKNESLRIFKQYWANSSYGLANVPGVFFEYEYGGVDFFFLDDRMYRDPYTKSDNAGKTMLGKGQLRWLKQALVRSDSPFKVIVSGSGWTSSKGEEGDSWAAALTERNALFEFIRERSIDGVVLLSGDTHRGEFNAIPWSEKGGYDFFELVSSPLAQEPSEVDRPMVWEPQMREPYSYSPNFGLLTFDMTAQDPWLRFELINVWGDSVWDATELKASELRNGVSSWKSKSSRRTRERYEREYERLQK
ncbi:MAG: hypothetical protein HN457_02175 [Opitutales bacterium]|nr:hypothetical protein [Opitutales bacterium]MBT5166927.1 hypothetical protein [Opitutales bacterium]MBT5814955.1 hypothetical protein [Opitutales bacterium]